MIVESLSIRRNHSFDINPDGYTGTLRIENKYGAIELVLNEQVSARILAVVGESAVEAAREIAQRLSASAFTQSLLPSPAPPGSR